MAPAAGIEATLGRVTLRMASSLDLGEVLGEITRGLARDLGAALARIWLIEPEDPKTLRLAASAGLSERLDGSRGRVPIGALKIGQIAETRSPLCTTKLSGDPRFPDQDWIRENGLASFAGYPLVYREELLGVLAMFARTELGAADLERLGVFAAQAAIAIENAALFARVDALMKRLEAENTYLREELEESRPTGIVGESAALRGVLDQLARVAPTTSTVLLLGETGTGKELFARAIHEGSPRRAGPLIKVNCAALAPSLVESELFGHEKGAVTGAAQRRHGRFELAHGGTLFLDEVTELPLELQAKLLRVLQEREVERVGGTSPVRVDVRIVAATNRDLAAEVRAGRFRQDLFFRLNVFPLRIPPLRERREDVRALAEGFLARTARAIDDEAVAYLEAYDWPGNVRELENVLERAAVLARGPRITVADLPDLGDRTSEPADGSLKERVGAYERTLIEDALRRANGNQSEAARLLRTSRATLQYRMKTLGL
jgi:transcriptional regulator with GAF, ATPase, and Fis domain